MAYCEDVARSGMMKIVNRRRALLPGRDASRRATMHERHDWLGPSLPRRYT
jgi:hypothetical protein